MRNEEEHTRTHQNQPTKTESLALAYLLHDCSQHIHETHDFYQNGLLTAEEAIRVMARRQIVEVRECHP